MGDQLGGHRIERSPVALKQVGCPRARLLQEPFHRGVDSSRGRLGELARSRELAPQEGVGLAHAVRDRPEFVAHAPQPDHPASEVRGGLEVALGAGRGLPDDDILGGPAAEHHRQAPEQVVTRVVAAVLVGSLLGHAERPPVGCDRHLLDGVRSRCEAGDHGMTALVVGDDSAFLRVHEGRLGRAEQHLVERCLELLGADAVVPVAGGMEGSLIGQVGQVGAGEARRRPGERCQVDRGRKRQALGVDPQDRLATCPVRIAHGHLAIEASRAQERRVEHVRPVGGRDHDDIRLVVEAVHLDEQLVEGLLALVIATAQAGPALAADRIDLVDEDDGGSGRLCLGEEVAHAAGADAHEHLDELGGRDIEERRLRLARHRACQQCLAGTGRTDEEDSAGQAGAEAAVAFGHLEEIDHLGELGLRVILTGDVREGDRGVLDVIETGARTPESEDALLAALRLAAHVHDHADQQENRKDGEREVRQDRAATGVLGRDRHVVHAEQGEQRSRAGRGDDGGEGLIEGRGRRCGGRDGRTRRWRDDRARRRRGGWRGNWTAGWWPQDRMAECALQGLPVEVHRRHRVLLDLGEEGRVRQVDRRTRRRQQQGREIPQQQDPEDQPPEPARKQWALWRLDRLRRPVRPAGRAGRRRRTAHDRSRRSGAQAGCSAASTRTFLGCVTGKSADDTNQLGDLVGSSRCARCFRSPRPTPSDSSAIVPESGADGRRGDRARP